MSDSLCALARQLGPKAFAECYRTGPEHYKTLLDLLEETKPKLSDSDRQALRVYLAAQDYIEAKSQLARCLLGRCTVTTTDSTATAVIRSIGLDEPLPADKVLEPVLANDPRLFEDYGMGYSYLKDSELEDVSWNEFHGSYSVSGYVSGQIVTRVLICPVTPPKAIPSILGEIQMCYAFGQMTAIHGLCRALIETALTDVCLRIGALTAAQVADDYFFKDFPPSRRINWTLRGPDRSEAFAIYTATSRVIHGTSEASDTASIVRRSVALVERLYSRHASHNRTRNA
jgi:hypothetical protein